MCGTDLNQRFIFSMVLLPVLSNTSDLYPCSLLFPLICPCKVIHHVLLTICDLLSRSHHSLHLWVWLFNDSENLLGKTQKFQIHKIVKAYSVIPANLKSLCLVQQILLTIEWTKSEMQIMLIFVQEITYYMLSL